MMSVLDAEVAKQVCTLSIFIFWADFCRIFVMTLLMGSATVPE
jgi:hypothetical protein